MSFPGVKMTGQRQSNHHRPHASRAFTLMEVMIALGIFFLAVFAILGLVSNTLRNARALRQPRVDAGMAAALFSVAMTNNVGDGLVSGDFGDAFPDYSWTADPQPVNTNGLYQVDFIVQRQFNGEVVSSLSTLLFLPNAKKGNPR
jgi:hypothetical protein